MEFGTLIGLLRADITNGGQARPRGGAKLEQVHPYRSMLIKARRKYAPKGDIGILKAFIPGK